MKWIYHYLKKRYTTIIISCLFSLFLVRYLADPYTDMLSAFWICLYLWVVSGEKFYKNAYTPILVGLIGVAAYLAKSYNFYFILLHLCLYTIYLIYTNRGKERPLLLIQASVKALLFFLILSGIWVFVLYSKYDCAMISSSGHYNFMLTTPKAANPLFFNTLQEPPNPTAVSIWEDFSNTDFGTWNPFESVTNFSLFYANSMRNLTGVWYLLRIYPPFYMLLFLIVYLLYKKTKPDRAALFYIASALFYTSGYLFFFIEKRYLYPLFILILISGVIVGVQVFRVGEKKYLSYILVACSIMSFVPYYKPMYEERDKQKEIYILSEKLLKLKVKGRIACDSHLEETIEHCFYSSSTFLGFYTHENDKAKMVRELKVAKADYYLVWEIPFDFSDEFTLLNQHTIPGLRIYKIK